MILIIGLAGYSLGKSATGGAKSSEANTSTNGAAPTPEASSSEPEQIASDVPSTDSQDPLGAGVSQQDLECGSGYIVVLSSYEASSPAETVRLAVSKFSGVADLHYLDPTQSCENLTAINDKHALPIVPYAGPFTDASSACRARMDYLDPSTYVLNVNAGYSNAIYCSCEMGVDQLPALNSVTDADPVGDNRFWVQGLQYMLWAAGYNPRKLVGGHFGPLTTQMVSQLQRDNGLLVTGEMNRETWDQLNALVCP